MAEQTTISMMEISCTLKISGKNWEIRTEIYVSCEQILAVSMLVFLGRRHFGSYDVIQLPQLPSRNSNITIFSNNGSFL